MWHGFALFSDGCLLFVVSMRFNNHPGGLAFAGVSVLGANLVVSHVFFFMFFCFLMLNTHYWGGGWGVFVFFCVLLHDDSL